METGDEIAPKQAESAVDAYFKNIIVLNRALTTTGQPFRDSRAQAVDRTGQKPERATFWLGCNVLRTPHLAELATSVMRLLNPELSILGGPSHCCGSPMSEKTAREQALGRAIGHFQAERAPTLVTWCPSCHTNLRKGSDASGWGFDELHITEFIARHLERLELRPRWSARVMLHGHTGTADRDKDLEYCRRILRAIPGVSIVAEHCDSELGIHCVPAIVGAQIGAEAFERKLAELLASVREAGADKLVTIYHSCYRELEKRLNSPGIAIENYITMLAKALDFPVPANVYRELAHGPAGRIEEIKCEARARGVEDGELQTALRAEFRS
jgi:Fe-S oxidoreductase